MLTDKEKRKIQFAARRLFNKKSIFVPTSIDDFRSIPAHHHFSHTLNLTNHRMMVMNDSGYEHFCNVVDVIDHSNHFNGMARRSDIWSAWHKVVEDRLSNGIAPENADEVVHAIEELVAKEIDDYTFVVPIFGIELEDSDTFPTGIMTIFRLSINALDAADVAHTHADIPKLIELYKGCLWLKGTFRGTLPVAEQYFSEQAVLAVGMLAVIAASLYEKGAYSFRIGTIMTPEEAYGPSVWFSWSETKRNLTTHRKFPKGQLFPLTHLKEEDSFARAFYRGFSVLQTNDRTELGEAIAKAVYWYSDAQRETVLVMKLIKYWSCVEAFFSFEKEEITHAVSTGLASVLIFGEFHFVPPSEYNKLKKRISSLYKVRSRAIHHGTHRHISDLEVAQFSQWVAWLIISMVALVELGYTKLREVKIQTERLDRLATQ